MKNFNEIWSYMTSVKASEQISSKGRVHLGQIMFLSPFLGSWVQLFLISYVSLIVLIRNSLIENCEFKFTVNYIIDTGSENSDPLTPNDLEYFQINKRHPRLMQLTIGASIYGEYWYSELKQRLFDMAERYQNSYIYGIGLNLYAVEKPIKSVLLTPEELKKGVWEIVREKEHLKDINEEITILKMKEKYLRAADSICEVNNQSKDETQGIMASNTTGQYIKPCNPDKKTNAFLVGDIETILVNDIHVPYAIGYVYAGDRDVSILDLKKPVTYCTENFVYSGDFKERSRLMFDDFIKGLISYSKRCGTKKVYFHNLSRFDGILLLKLLLEDDKNEWVLKPIIREHNVYQVVVYDRSDLKKPILDIRDSLKLLPGSLKSLAETMCPELGGKGSIPHDELNEFNISEKKEALIKYLEQDILILAGVLRKAQEKYWNRYMVDITNSLTVSSMAMKIYRTHYYPKSNPIYRPQPNKASFIRRGYYGGHTDVYKPYGKNLFYYDINSLYPYAMTKPMPSGAPIWRGSLKGCDLDGLFGFVEAKVTCPDSIKVPLLPYKDPKSGTLLFPAGTFTGVYFTEELKLASKLGYQIELKHGYLFEKKESPFSLFVKEIYDERLEAKKKGDQVMSSLHKLTMNSLYGRFGIKPECNITEICDREKLEQLMSIYQFSEVEPVNGTHYVVSYTGMLQIMKGHTLSEKAESLLHRNKMLNNNSTSAVQMSAAITAYARIHMYKYISLPGSYYTDTDSVALDKPLPDSEVSSYELGKLKLEYKNVEGYFLAPKCYALVVDSSTNIIRMKGLAKDKVNLSWFIEQYKNIGRVLKKNYETSFKINWPKLNIYRASIMLNLGIDPSTKRNLVIDENNRWVDTLPLKISDSLVVRQDKPKSLKGFKSNQLPSVTRQKKLLNGIESNQLPTIPHSESIKTMPESNQLLVIEPLKEQRLALKIPEKLSSELKIPEELSSELKIPEELSSELKILREQLQFERSERERVEKQRNLELQILKEQLQFERSQLQFECSQREMLEEQRKIERERVEEQRNFELQRLKEQFRDLEQRIQKLQPHSYQGSLDTSESDKGRTMALPPTEQSTQAFNKKDIESTNGTDFSSEPSNIQNRRGRKEKKDRRDNKGKREEDKKKKYHPLPREPPFFLESLHNHY